jgi:hypothetical protein
MGQSYRIRTELGINKTINVQLDQDFEFLEILSLKIQQTDVYSRSCSEYGVVVGRVTANNGFGVPNARVSVFIPISSVDESNPLITSVYPYKSPTDKNEDGFRYNLLPYEKSYSTHAATGTLPTRDDALTDGIAVEIYDKYYKYTTKTNESGDYMIMGVPLGSQTLVMDIDLSDIGEFSLTPQDLIRMGLASEAQVAGNRFKTSNDLSSLPQIVSLTRTLSVAPLWGDPEICQIAVNRVDFDLRDDANIDIQPTSVFMGSIYSTTDSQRLRRNAKPQDDMGNLCGLSTGPGSILAIRQTINYDADGNPILELFQLEKSGNIIDGNGVWMTELPMNLDYFITNEFGEKVLSNDPTVGIPTKGKYRFKVKWSQSPSLSEQTRRAYFLVPNVKEYGWASNNSDPTDSGGVNEDRQKSSYYFGLDWSGYTEGFEGTSDNQRELRNNILNQKINCEDTFYQFEFNKVYTVSGFIDQFKNGAKGRFIGIKEIDSNECASTINKFPVNEGFRNFDLFFFIFSIILQVIQLIGLPLLIIYHFLAFLWNNFAVAIIAYILYELGKEVIAQGSLVAGAIAGSASFGATAGLIIGHSLLAALYAAAIIFILIKFEEIVAYKFGRIKLPMITYPDCQSCECDSETTEPNPDDDTEQAPAAGLLSQLSNGGQYAENLQTNGSTIPNRAWPPVAPDDDNYDTYFQMESLMQGQGIGGSLSKPNKPTIFKINSSRLYSFPAVGDLLVDGFTIPPGERVNIYNTRKKFFDNVNKIKVTFSSPTNGTKSHLDNTLTVLSVLDLEPGTLLTFVDPRKTKDTNYLYSATTASGGYKVNGINGIIKTSAFTADVRYATSQTSDTVVTYDIPAYPSECVSSMVISITEPGTVTYRTCPGSKVTLLFTGQTTGATNPEGLISPEFPLITGITNVDCIDLTNTGGTAEYSAVTYGVGCQNYIYPSDIEYYQVLTAITITKKIVNGQPQYSFPGSTGTTGPSFWKTLNAENKLATFQYICGEGGRECGLVPLGYPNYNILVNSNAGFSSTQLPNAIYSAATSNFADYENQKVLILQRGVDPYSPLMINKYGIGRILGYLDEDAVTFTAMTRMNIPIQALPPSNGVSVQKHNNQNNICYSSYFYTPGIVGQTSPGLNYSAYTTPNFGFYGALDSSVSRVFTTSPPLISTDYVQNITVNNTSSPPITGVASKTNNRFYSASIADNYYDGSEDLSGGAIMTKGNYVVSRICLNFAFTFGLSGVREYCDEAIYGFIPTSPSTYFSPILYPTSTGTSEVNMSNSSQIIMRTDRLPSSDYIDDKEILTGSVSLLQQNAGFAVYPVGGAGYTFNNPSISLGADLVTADIEGQLAATNVLTTLGSCEDMVGLDCYSGNGVNFGVKLGCQAGDVVESGCYVMVNDPLFSLGQDLGTFAEWGFRFRFFYGLCRGVLSQSFMNNWVNGSLYAFPIQVDTYFNKLNQPESPKFAKQVVYFEKDTNNFYYRSSPYRITGGTSGEGAFIGRPVSGLRSPVNRRNLLFPTTIINLGIKDDFYKEIIFDPSAKGYIMKSLVPTSYSDTSDLVNLFVISRITDEGFLRQIISFGDNALQQLFSRDGSSRRIDADLAQTMSINSEYGVIPFSPQFYSVTGAVDDPVQILGDLSKPTMAVFFSSTTQDIQNKDYLTPGVIDFRPSNNANAITYPYGIKSQEVPYYQWNIKSTATAGVFGEQGNNWATNVNDIFSRKYQSLDRRAIIKPSYMIPSIYSISDLFARGYLFNGSATTASNLTYVANAGNWSNPTTKFLVGAPNHFYFGLIKGETALDKFKELYSIDE